VFSMTMATAASSAIVVFDMVCNPLLLQPLGCCREGFMNRGRSPEYSAGTLMVVAPYG